MTVGLLVARAIAPGRHELELDVYVLALGGLALLMVVARLREVAQRAESPLEAALAPREARPARVEQLERLEREVFLAASTAFDLHFRLRPVLREIAAPRLESHGLRLDGESKRVPEALGEELWEIVRPDREPPEDRHSPGPGLRGMRRIVERLESI